MANTKFNPIISKIPDVEDILKTDFNILGSKYKNLPLLKLGYQ